MNNKVLFVLLLLAIFSESKVISVGDKIVVYWILERKQGDVISVADNTSRNSFQDLQANETTRPHLEKISFNQQIRENQSWKTPRMIAILCGLSLLFFCYASLYVYKCLLLYF